MAMKIASFFATTAYEAYKEDKESGRVIWNLTVSVCQLPKELPLDPNARLANEKRQTVKNMLDTLAKEPEEFIFYNNGILIVADSIQVKNNGTGRGFDVELLLVSPEEEEEKFIGNGIVNGGHTYTAIMKARDNYEKLQSKGSKSKLNPATAKNDYSELEKASVQIFVLVNINKEEEISKISRYRNTSESVEEFSLKNLAGEWDIIQEHLPPEYKPYVAFREGEDKQYDVTDLVRRLACINNKVYPWREADGSPKNPSATCSAYGTLIKNWKKDDFREIVPLLKDILHIEEKLRSEYDQQKGLSKLKGVEKKPYNFITGKSFNHTLPITFVFPILAAFRVFIKDGKWEKPVEQLWDEMGNTLLNNLLTTYRNEGRGNPAAFGRSPSTWSNLLLVPMQLKLTE